MSSSRKTRLAAAGVALLACAGALTACTPKPADGGPKEWLAAVCPPDADYTADFEPLRQLAELGIAEQLRCEWPGDGRDEESIEVYVVRQDPETALTNTADSYASGDGIAPDWLYRDLGGEWAAAFTYDSGRSLDPLESIGFGR